MAEALANWKIDPAGGPPAALAAEAWRLRPPPPHERASVLHGEAALLVDRLLVRVARGRGALDVALGEGLAALACGDGALRLGFSGIGDYARERLGLSGRTAQAMARLARELRSRPLLAAAVRRGEVSARKAQVLLPVARGDAEAGWVERARSETVRALEAAVRAEAAAAPEEDEAWERAVLPLSPEQRATVDEALALAGEHLGATAPRWQRLEVVCQEFLGAHADPHGAPDEDASGRGAAGPGWAAAAGAHGAAACALLHAPLARWMDAAKAALEEETARWAFLEPADPVPAPSCGLGAAVVPQSCGVAADPARLDAELRRLAALRDRWDELVGHLAMLVRMLGLWRVMQFCSFAHYCTERLGLAARTVEQRAWLERRLHALPALRRAIREGRVSYEQARLVASRADDASVDAWIARAEATTCVALRRELEAADDAQMCARGELEVRLPARVERLLEAAIRAARAASATWISPGEALARVARHFLDTWKPASPARRDCKTPHQRAIARDGGRCQVPGCSRAAVHAHHVVYRSRGGSDDPENLVALCAAHHLHGVHRGYVRVRGRAPGELRWEVPALPS